MTTVIQLKEECRGWRNKAYESNLRHTIKLPNLSSLEVVFYDMGTLGPGFVGLLSRISAPNLKAVKVDSTEPPWPSSLRARYDTINKTIIRSAHLVDLDAKGPLLFPDVPSLEVTLTMRSVRILNTCEALSLQGRIQDLLMERARAGARNLTVQDPVEYYVKPKGGWNEVHLRFVANCYEVR